jgi:hypothetical protein
MGGGVRMAEPARAVFTLVACVKSSVRRLLLGLSAAAEGFRGLSVPVPSAETPAANCAVEAVAGPSPGTRAPALTGVARATRAITARATVDRAHLVEAATGLPGALRTRLVERIGASRIADRLHATSARVTFAFGTARRRAAPPRVPAATPVRSDTTSGSTLPEVGGFTHALVTTVATHVAARTVAWRAAL